MDFPYTIETEGEAEFLAVAHLRGWAHNSTPCPMCKAQVSAFSERRRAVKAETTLRSIIEG